MASLTGQTISSTYDGLLKTSDNDVIGATAKEITDGLGNGTGVALDDAGNVTIQGDFNALGAIKDSLGNVGLAGQVLQSTATGTLWVDAATAGVDSVIAGTGISVDTSTGDVTVTNSAPDQTVSLTDGTGITTSGTYPNFTITNSEPNATHTGDVTGATVLTIANDVITYAKLGTEFTTTDAQGSVSGTATLDFRSNQVFTATMTADTSFSFSNADIGMTKDLILTGAFEPTFPLGTKQIAGTYDPAVSNFIQIVAVANGDYWLSVSQAQ